MSQQLRGWGGLATYPSPHDLPPSRTVEQTNWTNVAPGILAGRKGNKPFTSFATPNSGAVISLAKYERGATQWLVYMTASGGIYATTVGTSFVVGGLRGTIPACFVRDRFGNLFAYNGLFRGWRWNGLSSGVQAGITAPVDVSTATTSGGGNSSAGDYYLAYRYVDADGNFSSLSELQTLSSVAASQQFAWTFDTSPEARVTQRQLFRSTAGQSDTLYLVTTITDNTATTYADTLSDDSLTADDANALPIYKDNGSANAYRFEPPPTDRPFFASYQDRCFAYGNATYTVSVAIVGTTLTVQAGLTITADIIGRYVYIAGETRGYMIVSVSSSTVFDIEATPAGDGQTLSCVIAPSPDRLNSLDWSEADEYESWPAANSNPIQQNTDDADNPTGLMPYNSYLWLLNERHVYRMSFTQQPDIDIAVSLAFNRGCLNNRCWVVAEGTAYMLDQFGIYAMNGGDPASVSDDIQNIFNDGTIDWSQSTWFHGNYEPADRVVKFWVTFNADSQVSPNPTKPKRSICYSLITKAIWIESYPWQIGGSARLTYNYGSGTLNRLILGVGGSQFYLASEGTSDGISTALRGTATSATATTLSDSTAAFATTIVNATISIIAGTGKGQTRVITARPSSTQVTVATWTTTPDTTSVYLIGAIECAVKTGIYTTEVKPDGRNTKRALRLCFQPLANSTPLNVQRYLNHDSSAKPWLTNYDQGGTGLTIVNGDPVAVADMLGVNGTTSDASGFLRLWFDDEIKDPWFHEAWMAVRLQAYQGLESLKLYYAMIEGVS